MRKIRIKAPGVMLASLCAAGLISVQVLTAPSAHAACTAGETYDASTGVCWSQAQTTRGVTGTGGVCLPGRLGLCMAGLQNSQMPGANLQPMPPAGPAPKSWP